MTGLEFSLIDLLGGLFSFFLTLFVLSYAFGDNFLFRLAIHIFIGVSTGFVAVAAFYSILWPQLFRPLVIGSLNERLYALLPLVLSILLAGKAFPRFSNLGSPVMSFLVGVGAATMIGGGLFGTLSLNCKHQSTFLIAKQSSQSGSDLGVVLINSSLVLFGTVVTFASFRFGREFLRTLRCEPFGRSSFGWGGFLFLSPWVLFLQESIMLL